MNMYMNKEDKEGKQNIRRADIILIIVCFLAAALAGFFFLTGHGEGRRLRISCDGEVLETLELAEAFAQERAVYYRFLFEEGGVVWEKYEEMPAVPAGVSYNVLCIAGGEIRMESADCRDQICVRHRPISGGGESIICLPHRLAVEVME